MACGEKGGKMHSQNTIGRGMSKDVAIIDIHGQHCTVPCFGVVEERESIDNG
jgi:hypothetical protein